MEILKPYRVQIDEIDAQIIDLLARRLDIVRRVATVKGEHGIPPVLEDRVEEVISNAIRAAEEKGVDPALVERFYTDMVDYCCRVEEDFIKSESGDTP